MSSPAPPLLTPAGVHSALVLGVGLPPTRVVSAVVARPARGFQVFRIDGFSWTKTLPGGERISSDPFTVGGLDWRVDYYPNGTDASKLDSDAISLYLRLVDDEADSERVRAQFKFSLLDLAGNAAYELPVETGVFTNHDDEDSQAAKADLGSGNAEFITKEELERRRQILLAKDCLAIRCDVGVVQVAEAVAVGETKRKGHGKRGRRKYYSSSDYSDDSDSDSDSDEDEGGRRQKPQPQDDREFIRQCLTKRRRTSK
ncbi:hypothetical protein EJB05_09253, partial [Eragrostis curvula]